MTASRYAQDEKVVLQLREVRQATRFLRKSGSAKTTDNKNRVLKKLSELLSKHQAEILSANQKDLASLCADKTTNAFVDRLTLTAERIKSMQESLQDVIALPDPVGETIEERRLPNGLLLKKRRAPLGVILMIFESRPNVVTEAFSLGFKSGNALILRGGSESAQTSTVLYRLIHQALKENGFPETCLWGITDTDRELVQFLMRQNKHIDILVPRGGEKLIEFVTQNATVPIIKNDRGMCHVYIHEDADVDMAVNVVVNAKAQRPGVCNSMETVLIHTKLKNLILPKLYEKLKLANVKWHVTPEIQEILQGKADVTIAEEKNWDTEYLDFEMNCKIVSSLEEALAHIENHGSQHSEAIVTSSEITARKFQEEIDAAAVYWNASTRFTDGLQFGLGGELGISTQKLHVRGPVGLCELTSARWVIDGTGQVRS